MVGGTEGSTHEHGESVPTPDIVLGSGECGQSCGKSVQTGEVVRSADSENLSLGDYETSSITNVSLSWISLTFKVWRYETRQQETYGETYQKINSVIMNEWTRCNHDKEDFKKWELAKKISKIPRVWKVEISDYTGQGISYQSRFKGNA